MATYRYATKELSIQNAKSFLERINATDTESDKKSTILYAVLGRSNQWDDEPNRNILNPTDQVLQYETQRDFIGGQKINGSHVSHVVRRINWSSGTVYAMYKDTISDLYNTDFYVITDELNVYKCLDNNKNSASTNKPTGYSTGSIKLPDGYVWKYLYSVSLGDSEKFLTTSHLPVKFIETVDASPETTRQQDVQDASVNGSIDIVQTNTGGSGYYQLSGALVEESPSSTTVRVSVGSSTGSFGGLSNNDDFYAGSSIYISSGTGAGQLRRIIDYVGESKTLTVNTAFDTLPTNGSTAVISPTVTVVGDGKGAQAYSTVNSGSGAISGITVVNRGDQYTRAKAIISDRNGSGATANTIISPPGGHGSDPIRELGGDKLMVNAKFDGSEGLSSTGAGYIPANTEFRTISLIKDPMLKVDQNNSEISTEVIAKSTNSPETLRFTHRLTISYSSMDGDDPTYPLYSDDIITNERMRLAAEFGQLEFVTELNDSQRSLDAMKNAIQGANGQIVYIRDDETISDKSFYTMYLNNVQSNGDRIPFAQDDILLRANFATGEHSDTKIAVVQNYKSPEANTYSGEVLYTESINQVTRSTEQIEDIKIILDF
jgi:hypothetical protein